MKDAARETVRVTGGVLRMVIVADTHGEPHPRALERVAHEKPHHILHAGDIGDLAVLDALAAIAPTTAVRGNIDAPTSAVPDAV
jgi:predicted phosphodiesterase